MNLNETNLPNSNMFLLGSMKYFLTAGDRATIAINTELSNLLRICWPIIRNNHMKNIVISERVLSQRHLQTKKHKKIQETNHLEDKVDIRTSGRGTATRPPVTAFPEFRAAELQGLAKRSRRLAFEVA